MTEIPLVVLGDLHLAPDSDPAVSEDAARLVRTHSGHEVVFNGDTFNLSSAAPTCTLKNSLRAVAQHHPAFWRALGEHLRTGGRATLIAGNHDAALGHSDARATLLDRLQLPTEVPLWVAPWLIRRGQIHIEHGHLYDPDNAPTHPLAADAHAAEPLGAALTRRFVAPQHAQAFAHAHDTTLVPGLLRAFRNYGSRAPRLVVSYYRTAAKLWLEAGDRVSLAEQHAAGERAVPALAAELGVEPTRLHALLRSRPRPTLHDRRDTFMRLYLDRSLATLLGLTGVAMLGSGGVVGPALAAASGGYLVASVVRSGNRYAGRLEPRLRCAAEHVRHLLGPELVVFGHSHQQDAAPHYLNPGSFAFCPHVARPYLLVEAQGRAELRAAARCRS